jgi:hypothetical protein
MVAGSIYSMVAHFPWNLTVNDRRWLGGRVSLAQAKFHHLCV